MDISEFWHIISENNMTTIMFLTIIHIHKLFKISYQNSVLSGTSDFQKFFESLFAVYQWPINAKATTKSAARSLKCIVGNTSVRAATTRPGKQGRVFLVPSAPFLPGCFVLSKDDDPGGILSWLFVNKKGVVKSFQFFLCLVMSGLVINKSIG